MTPCIKAVCKHINDLVKGLCAGGQSAWDVRFDYLAFSDYAGSHFYKSTYLDAGGIINAIYGKRDESKFFTSDFRTFQKSLNQVDTYICQQHLHALDLACDFPWRPSSSCHRVIILLTDDSPDEGCDRPMMDKLINKLMEKRIKLFIVAPAAEEYYYLAQADRSEYNDSVPHLDLTPQSIDFSKMLETIGKSVSVSQFQSGGSNDPKPLYGQDRWRSAKDSGVKIVVE